MIISHLMILVMVHGVLLTSTESSSCLVDGIRNFDPALGLNKRFCTDDRSTCCSTAVAGRVATLFNHMVASHPAPGACHANLQRLLCAIFCQFEGVSSSIKSANRLTVYLNENFAFKLWSSCRQRCLYKDVDAGTVFGSADFFDWLNLQMQSTAVLMVDGDDWQFINGTVDVVPAGQPLLPATSTLLSDQPSWDLCGADASPECAPVPASVQLPKCSLSAVVGDSDYCLALSQNRQLCLDNAGLGCRWVPATLFYAEGCTLLGPVRRGWSSVPYQCDNRPLTPLRCSAFEYVRQDDQICQWTQPLGVCEPVPFSPAAATSDPRCQVRATVSQCSLLAYCYWNGSQCLVEQPSPSPSTDSTDSDPIVPSTSSLGNDGNFVSDSSSSDTSSSWGSTLNSNTAGPSRSPSPAPTVAPVTEASSGVMFLLAVVGIIVCIMITVCMWLCFRMAESDRRRRRIDPAGDSLHHYRSAAAGVGRRSRQAMIRSGRSGSASSALSSSSSSSNSSSKTSSPPETMVTTAQHLEIAGVRGSAMTTMEKNGNHGTLSLSQPPPPPPPPPPGSPQCNECFCMAEPMQKHCRRCRASLRASCGYCGKLNRGAGDIYCKKCHKLIGNALPMLSFQQVTRLVPGLDAEDTCSICMDRLMTAKLAMLECKHVYHYECIGLWLNQPEKNRNLCPLCRSKFKKLETGGETQN